MIMVCNRCTNEDDCPVAEFKDPGVEFINPTNKLRFDKIKQGILEDCWFVASLSSYLFIKWPDAPALVNGKYNFVFCDGKKTKKIATDGKVCVDKNTNQIYGAKEIDTNTGITYSWPAVYEKAYAAFLENSDPPSLLTYLNFNRSPFPCLSAISCAKKYDSLTSDFDTGADIFNEIQKRTRLMDDGASEEVLVPYVATTNVPSFPGLESRHSYSLLGLFQSEGKQYIILRDPLMKKILQSPVITWKYQDNSGIFTRVYCPSDEGIFAISVEDFKNNFEGFGYASVQ